MIRSVRLPPTPPSSRPRPTDHSGLASRKLSTSDDAHGHDRQAAQRDGELGAGAERRTRVVRQVQDEQVADDLDVAVLERRERPLLRADVEGVRRNADQREEPPRATGSGVH